MTGLELQREVESLDAVPEPLKDFYIEGDDGKFKLEDVSGLKSALQRERDDNKRLRDLTKKANKSDGGGENLTAAEKKELNDLRKEREQREEEEAKKKGEYEKLLAKKDEKYKQQLSEIEQKATTAEKKYFDTLKKNEATLAINSLKGKPKALLDHVVKHLTVEEQNGIEVVVVVDRDGTPRSSEKDPSKPMSVAELVEVEFANDEDFMGLFEGRGHSGSGASGSARTGSGGAVTISRADAKNHQKYKAAEEKAKKMGVGLVVTD